MCYSTPHGWETGQPRSPTPSALTNRYNPACGAAISASRAEYAAWQAAKECAGPREREARGAGASHEALTRAPFERPRDS